MNPSPFPSPLDVVFHSGPADWWVILAGLGPLAVLIAALLAFYINWRTLKQRTAADTTALEQKREADVQALKQKTEADSRAEWWRRAQWALDRALDEDEGTKALGLATLDVLARSELARKEELELFDIAWKSVAGPDHNGESDEDVDEAQASQQLHFVPGSWRRPGSFVSLRSAYLQSLWTPRSEEGSSTHLFSWLPGLSGGRWSSPTSVDSDDNIGDNGTTDEDKTKEDGL
ncbi:hypothetical protein ASG92_05590 [Arthrobacter sp. Soil736]|uniref:hypothetical protein n=1 Tax=Arthrobacter sp. Soil736 TaxID=1736395 RepID=UPI0006F77FCE|nr:hypothetical protein [Arthrobacter sp. Soil736]KRE53036.1 hypothetical protein ASG92_05590 [Arthrobacter sp. Soil736]